MASEREIMLQGEVERLHNDFNLLFSTMDSRLRHRKDLFTDDERARFRRSLGWPWISTEEHKALED